MSNTLADAITFARTQTQTDSNGITDTNGIVFANAGLLDIRRMFIKSGVDASGVQEAYMDGMAGVGTYLYPANMFFLKAIEVNYTDTQAQNYVVANLLDVSNLPAWQSFSFLRSNASTQSPSFDNRGDWFEIFPTPTSANNVSQFFRIFYFLQPTPFVSTTDVISYPESLDYRVLGWAIAANYLYSIGSSVGSGRNVHLLGDTFIAKAAAIIADLKNTLGRDVQTPTQAQTIQLTGFEF